MIGELEKEFEFKKKKKKGHFKSLDLIIGTEAFITSIVKSARLNILRDFVAFILATRYIKI